MAEKKTKTKQVRATVGAMTALSSKKAKKTASTKPIVVPKTQFELARTTFTVIGDTETKGVMIHAWAVKAIREMEQIRMKKPQKGRETLDPIAEYLATFYWDAPGDEGRPTIKVGPFKMGVCYVVPDLPGISVAKVKRAFRVCGEFTPIYGLPAFTRGLPRVANGHVDLRYRPLWEHWCADVTCTYRPAVISVEQLGHLLDLAGYGAGIGEMRNEKKGAGQYGGYRVATDQDGKLIKALKKIRPTRGEIREAAIRAWEQLNADEDEEIKEAA